MRRAPRLCTLGGLSDNMMLCRVKVSRPKAQADAGHSLTLSKFCFMAGSMIDIHACVRSGSQMLRCYDLCRVKLHWPKAQADAGRSLTANRTLLHGWLREMHPTLASTCSAGSITQVRLLRPLLTNQSALAA